MSYYLNLPGGWRIAIDRLAFPFLALVSVVLFFSGIQLRGWVLLTWLAVIAILWIASRQMRKKRQAQGMRAILRWSERKVK